MKADLALHPGAALAAQLLGQFGRSGSELCVGGHRVRELVAAHGSPLYVVDAAIVRSRFRALRQALAGFAEIYYSIKANPQPALLACLVAEGAGLEVASGAELLRALGSGCPPQRVVFAGPAKSAEELALAVQHGIAEVHVETFEEIEALARCAAQAQARVGVALRLNPAYAAGGAMRMGGRAAPFGFDEELLPELLAVLARHPQLQLRGLHMFAATQVLDAHALLKQWHYGLELAQRLAQASAHLVHSIDLGGGLGIPYHKGQATLDLAALAEGVQGLHQVQAQSPLLSQARVMVEPGRWLVGPAGVYLVGVRAVKHSRGQRFVMVDGGMHHHLAATGNLGQVIKHDHPLLAATALGAPELGSTQVAGPLCTPLDSLGRETPLPELAAGDVLAVLQAGAYGLTASPVGFLSHPMPAELLVDGERITVMRPRGTMQAPLVNVPLQA